MCTSAADKWPALAHTLVPHYLPAPFAVPPYFTRLSCAFLLSTLPAQCLACLALSFSRLSPLTASPLTASPGQPRHRCLAAVPCHSCAGRSGRRPRSIRRAERASDPPRPLVLYLTLCTRQSS